ncbi:MAG: hypothetical protein SFY67_19400 [Candidatus Melainabacteria bacterium]|nr:hypothetical protein [Candidatus Melainabacteria bacterium]
MSKVEIRMKAQNKIAKAPRFLSLVIAFGISLGCSFISSDSVNAQNYPGAGQTGSGTIYLPNGIPFQIGSNYPGGMHFPHHPNFYVPPGSSSRTPSSSYFNNYRYRNRGKVSSLVDSPNAQHTKSQTTWEAPTAIDDKIDLEIESTQVNAGIDSSEAVNLIWTRAKQYYEGHYYEKALKMLDQLEPLRKHNKVSLISDASIDKMRKDIDLKLGRHSLRPRSKSQYFLHGSSSSQNQPISLDSFLDPSRVNKINIPQRGRNFYP